MKKKSAKQKSKKISKRKNSKVSKRNPYEKLPVVKTGPLRLITPIKTLQEAKIILNNHGMSIRPGDFGGYEVYPIDDPRHLSSYETNDLSDAVGTGISMSKRMINNLLLRRQYDDFT